MKLQIIEYKIPDLLKGNILYRYILYIDERALVWSGSSPEKLPSEKVYDELSRYLANNCKDYNINSYSQHNRIYGVEEKVVFEKEVSDSYLKELYNESRIKALEEDFKNDKRTN